MKPYIVAHRGYKLKAIENTIESFKIAFESGADFIEGDFWLSKDNEIVCYHNEYIYQLKKFFLSKRTINISYSDIKNSVNLNRFFNETLNIPRLEEIFEIIPEGKGLFIEIKDNREKFLIVLKNKLEESRFPSQRLRIISYHPMILKLVKNYFPQVKTFWIFDWFVFQYKCRNKIIFHKFLKTIEELKCDGIDLNASTNLDELVVKRLKEMKKEICVYDVNDSESMRRMIDLNVDYITTDYPDKLSRMLNP